MNDPRLPQEGELQIVVLLDDRTFIAWAPATTANDLMDSFERRARLTPEARSDLLLQMSLRVEICNRLRGVNAPFDFTNVLAAGCLWLALRHYSECKALTDGLAQQMARDQSAVITISIGTNPGTAPGTAWAVMIGDRIHDGREQLAAQSLETVSVIRPQR